MSSSRYYQIWIRGQHIMDVYAESARSAKKKAIPDLRKSGYRNVAQAIAQ